MPPMNMIESQPRIGISTSSQQKQEEVDEVLVELFIAQTNAMRRSLGLPELSVGALALVSWPA